MQPLYTAFYTFGSLYEREADRLRASLDVLGLEHDIRGVESRGDWHANAGLTADHISTMQAAYPDRPLVQLDADAVVCQAPDLFLELAGGGADIAVHYRRGQEMLNGTVWLAPSEPARQVIALYRDLVAAQTPRNEQLMLQNAIGEMSDLIKVQRLPPGYCFIPDIMQDDLAPDEPIVIAQMQASRERVGSAARDRRRMWILDWESRSVF